MRKFLILLAPAALLGGCSSAYGGLDSVHQPVVERSNYALDLTTAGGSLAPGELARLDGWLGSMRLGYGDRVAIDDPSGSANMREQISKLAAKFGLLLADHAPVTTGAITPGTVRVIVTRTIASVPGCPNFTNDLQPNYAQTTSPNFGCSVNSNLAAMVANPEDLVRGQPGTGVSDPVTAAKAVEALRNAAPVAGAGGSSSVGSASGGSQ